MLLTVLNIEFISGFGNSQYPFKNFLQSYIYHKLGFRNFNFIIFVVNRITHPLNKYE